MATASSSKTRREDMSRMEIYGGDFYVTKAKPHQAKVRIRYQISKQHERAKTFAILLPLHSLWVDPRTNNAMRAYMTVDNSVPEQQHFYQLLRENVFVNFAGKGSFVADRHNVVRWGPTSDTRYEGTDATDGNYSRYFAFNTKSLAIQAFLQEVNSVVQVGGTPFIDWNSVPDNVLLESGLERVPDLMGQGVDMWIGNPAKFLKGSESYYSYVEKPAAQEFLKLLQRHMNSPVQEGNDAS